MFEIMEEDNQGQETRSTQNHKKSKQLIDLIANPIKFSVSNIKYKKAPPVLGEDTELFLKKFLKISAEGLKKLKLKKII